VSNLQTLEDDPRHVRSGAAVLPRRDRPGQAASSVLTRFSTQLGQWLDGDPLAFSSRPLAWPEMERVREAQLASIQRDSMAPLAVAALAAAILPIGMWNTPARWLLVFWALLPAANMALSRALRERVDADCLGSASGGARAFRRAALRTFLHGAVWACGFALAQNDADAVQRTLIATLSMCVMSGGALQLAFAPPLAFGFIAPLAVSSVFAAFQAPGAGEIPILAAQLVNAGFLAFQAHVQARRVAGATITHFSDARAARRDPLTGLGNRVAFEEHLAAAFQRLAVEGEKFALLAFDLDCFQLVNAEFGHRAGDEMILRAADVLRKAAEEDDFVARLGGGGGFALIAVQTPNRAAADALARKVGAEFRRPFAFAWGDSASSVTIGVALAPEHGEDGDRLARGAEAALHMAKQNGRGSISFVGDAEDEGARQRREFEAALRRALRNGEMDLEFQPIVDAASGVTRGFEALLRWRRPGHATAPASQFIRAAEAGGCLDEIGVWALREATRVAATWPKPLRLAVNISAAQLKSPSLAAAVREIAEKGDFAPARLELEIAESSLIDDFEAAAASLNALRHYGVRIALGGFGGEASSMTAIARLPLDRIKIDRALVEQAPVNPRCSAIIRLAARLAKELGLALTGEGVETQAQLDLLRSAGYEEVQGYLFSKPMAAEALPALFKRSPGVRPLRALQAGRTCDNCTLPWCLEAGMCRFAEASA
jgi:diguanylate cyclase (GGDEF)-like protein